MFGKKEAPAAPNRYEVDAKFKSALRRIRKSCEEYDAKIEAEMQNAIRYRRAGNRDEVPVLHQSDISSPVPM